MQNVERPESRTISVEPDWEGFRKWVLLVHRTHPDLARRMAMQMGREAPQLPDEPVDPDPVEPGSFDYPDFG